MSGGPGESPEKAKGNRATGRGGSLRSDHPETLQTVESPGPLGLGAADPWGVGRTFHNQRYSVTTNLPVATLFSKFNCTKKIPLPNFPPDSVRLEIGRLCGPAVIASWLAGSATRRPVMS